MKLSFPVTLLLSVASASAQQSSLQFPKSSIGGVQSYSLEANCFIDALLKLSARFQFPLGVEWVKSADTLKPVRLSQTYTTVADVIQSVVSRHAGYDWRTEDGVVHVFQRDLVKDSRNPLNITVKEFGWNHKMILSEANTLLAQLVGQVVNPLPIGRGIGGSFPRDVGEPTFDLNIRDGSARSILNRIVTVSKVNIWVATFPSVAHPNPSGFLQPTGAQNNNGPFWTMLRWGDPPLENMVR
jgi:hypothetical protein